MPWDKKHVDDKLSGIYMIRNTSNGKYYIGSSKQLGERAKNHLSNLRRGFHCNAPLQNEFNVCGEDVFEFDVLMLCEEHELLEFEQFYFDELEPEYNISKSAFHPMGMVHTVETKQKLSKLMLGNKRFLGKRHSLVTRQKMSMAKKGVPRPLEFVARMRVFLKGKTGSCGMTGRSHTVETKAKISSALRCWYVTPAGVARKLKISDSSKNISEETRRKISANHSGSGMTSRSHTVESKELMSSKAKSSWTVERRKHMGDIHRGKSLSEDHRRKMSEAAKCRYQNQEERDKMAEAMRKSWEYRMGVYNALG